MRSIDDLYEQILIESKYSAGYRDRQTGVFMLVIASTWGLLSIVFTFLFNDLYVIDVPFWSIPSFWFLLVPSLPLGLYIILLYYGGSDKIEEAMDRQRALKRLKDEMGTEDQVGM